MELREDDLKEMLPVIGDRVRIRKLFDGLQQVKYIKQAISNLLRFFSLGIIPTLIVKRTRRQAAVLLPLLRLSVLPLLSV